MSVFSTLSPHNTILQALLAQKVLAIQQSRGLLPQQTAEGTRASRDPGAASPAPNSTGRIADSPGDHGSSSSDSSGDEGLSGAADSADERDEAGGAQDPAGNASKQQRPRRPYYAWYNFTTYGGDEGQHSTKVKAIRLDDTSRVSRCAGSLAHCTRDPESHSCTVHQHVAQQS